jgi:SAM-dependent methyltransferase
VCPEQAAASGGEQVRHPIFARVYERLARGAERRGGAEHRRTLLEGCSGRVIEVGAGSGANFAHYPATVSEVLAVEPEASLRERARRAAALAPVTVSVRDAGAGDLPGETGSFDVGVASLVLWPRIAGGCHLSRDTRAGIERAGFEIESCRRFAFSPAAYLPPAPHILGVARRP